MDRRWNKLAEILVKKSAKIKSGEKVMIAMVEPEAFDLTKAVYEEVIKVGGYPQVQMLSEEFKHSILTYGNKDQNSWVPEIEMWGMNWADVYIGLRGAHNLGELGEVPSHKLAIQQEAMGQVSRERWEKTRWTLVRIPTEAFAVQANCDLPSLLDMFFEASFVDVEKEAQKWKEIAKKLEKGKIIRIVGEKTDLSFSVEGRKWFSDFSEPINVPAGETFTSPICSSIDGTIYFENPGILGGKLMKDITFTWRSGKLINASSSTNEDFFHSIVFDNPGAQTIGEFALGTNREMTRFCTDILFDEKIYGTMHMAIGRAFKIAGGKNDSSIHWDIIKDTRLPGSVIYLDGEPILKEGQFLF